MALRLAVDGQASQGGEGGDEATNGDEFRVGVAVEDGGVRVRPLGDVDMATIGRLRDRTDAAMAIGAGRIVLDLRATTFLDSSGLHLVVELHTWATHNGIEFAVIPGPPIVQRAFEAAGLSARTPFLDGTQRASRAGGFGRPVDVPRDEQSVRPRA
jgi:anti-sigma B factor antagonist